FMPYVAEELYRNLVAEQDPTAPASVHLAGWPEVDEALIDEGLLASTAVLLQTVGLGRAARRSAGLRVRQTLSELLVRTPLGGDELGKLEDVTREERHVRAVRCLGGGDALVESRFKPNLPIVGRKSREDVPAIRAALARLEGDRAVAVAHAVGAGEPVELQA